MTSDRTGVFHFRPSARLQRYLGSELIADPNVAIIEFVKNSYDAGASTVHITFRIDDEPDSLTIADNGVGMTVADFRDHWMRPGFSEKGAVEAPRKPRRNATAAEVRQAARVPVGEKGIGRLAAGRLGERLDVFTRRARNQPWLHVEFDWRHFDDMNQLMEEIEIPFDLDTVPDDPPFETGAVVVISELSQRWGERMRGRAVRGRRTTRLGRLKQDLEFLIRPMSAQEEEFGILLDSDLVREPNDVGEITPQSAVEEADYSLEFRYEVADGKPVIQRTIRRSSEAAEAAETPRLEELDPVALTAKLAKTEGRPDALVCGPFDGRFLYNPPAAAQRAREIDESPVGVLLYRDGILVEPYGLHDNDWLGVRARKAQRQGHAAIQPDTFFGHVRISRRQNKPLRDQTNRLGLLNTPESENFIDHVRAEFSFFEDLLYAEILETRWQTNREDEARRLALEAQERSRILLRALAHALRQPLQGLGYIVVSLRAIRDHPDLPDALRDEIDDVLEQTQGHLADTERLINPLLSSAVPEFTPVSVRDLVTAAINQTKMAARTTGARVAASDLPDTEVLVAPELVIQALASIISNGIEAPRDNGATAQVDVAVETRKRDVAILVTDNGTGIPGANPTTALASIPSTKGRPAVGLQNAESALVAARGRLRLVETGPNGTRFEVVLPSKVRGLSSS